ncbi:MAG: site-2 protease family protein [Candidatus Omnitrophica bacterium]|nr:site-2 protease family protein [Candidatus Omnitrophota bacterium]MDD4012970.1 site-2 protease family protein [Candidatus Omnitrophota bacterium]
MTGSIRLARIFGIDIDIHITFFLLLAFFFMVMGASGLILILGVFFFVTMHELCHSVVAMRFGIKVKRITLLPIGGIASMSEMPTKPYQEFLISIAGPLSNIAVVVIFFYPLYVFLGPEKLFYPLKVMAGTAKSAEPLNTLAHIYWINLILAVFNIIPAFPMDGGRVLRSILANRMSYREATRIAVRLGHIFALVFGYLGIVHGQIFLLLVAVFIYFSASTEGMQVDVQETIKKYTVKDVLYADPVSLEPGTSLSKILEFMLHRHQENFPVMMGDEIIGLVTKREVLLGLHERDKDATAEEIMRKDVPAIDLSGDLYTAQKMMQTNSTPALPVVSKGKLVGLIAIDDISRIYMIENETGRG